MRRSKPTRRDKSTRTSEQVKELKPRTSNETPEWKETRRGERNRNKPDFYGGNIMVTQLSPRNEDNRDNLPNKKERRKWGNATRGTRSTNEKAK